MVVFKSTSFETAAIFALYWSIISSRLFCFELDIFIQSKHDRLFSFGLYYLFMIYYVDPIYCYLTFIITLLAHLLY
jgi:hypothetical protein